ncbi:MAG TPA: geranylgeranylglycerol-phosphate geranylgeranyltransferase [Salinimicrobium sp.]|nr:geranylgeranylglycerol-phosphate geranylgeranyltransferase [Salinimicrobium sp.]
MTFLRLIRFPNLIIIILTQCCIRFFLFEKFEVSPALELFDFFLLVIATVCLAAGGNIINDIYDVETDWVNKPSKLIIGKKISEKTALVFYIIFNFIAVGIGFYLSHRIGKSGFSVLFILISALLYFYSSRLKQSFLIGNILIGFLISLVFLIVGIFDLLPNFHFSNSENRHAFNILFHFSIFAFLINFLREMLKDQEDINGDYKTGMKTMPIVLGRSRANKIIAVFSILPIAGIVYYIYTYLYENTFAVLFVLFFILGPLLYFAIKIFEIKKKRDYKRMSLILKILMLIGILAIVFYPEF